MPLVVEVVVCGVAKILGGDAAGFAEDGAGDGAVLEGVEGEVPVAVPIGFVDEFVAVLLGGVVAAGVVEEPEAYGVGVPGGEVGGVFDDDAALVAVEGHGVVGPGAAGGEAGVAAVGAGVEDLAAGVAVEGEV